jgi:hypothetical protein
MLVNVVPTWTICLIERLQSIRRFNDLADFWALGDALNVGHGGTNE